MPVLVRNTTGGHFVNTEATPSPRRGLYRPVDSDIFRGEPSVSPARSASGRRVNPSLQSPRMKAIFQPTESSAEPLPSPRRSKAPVAGKPSDGISGCGMRVDRDKVMRTPLPLHRRSQSAHTPYCFDSNAPLGRKSAGKRTHIEPAFVQLEMQREKAAQARRLRRMSTYSLEAPFGTSGYETDESVIRERWKRENSTSLRRAVTPSPVRSVDSERSLLFGQKGKRHVQPMQHETDEVRSTSKRIKPERRTNTLSSELCVTPEREFLPTNFQERGMDLKREGANNCFQRGGGKHRPVEQLVLAWQVSPSVPSRVKGTARKHYEANQAINTSTTPWGTRRHSMNRYHRRSSIEASLTPHKKKVQRRGAVPHSPRASSESEFRSSRRMRPGATASSISTYWV
eukprot:Sspe_Gene.85565::Locus_56300_Transcript_1_2_Confidence_0.667_Length_1423::g.85565::m.85565